MIWGIKKTAKSESGKTLLDFSSFGQIILHQQLYVLWANKRIIKGNLNVMEEHF